MMVSALRSSSLQPSLRATGVSSSTSSSIDSRLGGGRPRAWGGAVRRRAPAAKPPGDRRQPVDELLDRLPDRLEPALVVEDDLGVDPVPGGPPLVLADDPAPRDRQRVAPVH